MEKSDLEFFYLQKSICTFTSIELVEGCGSELPRSWCSLWFPCLLSVWQADGSSFHLVQWWPLICIKKLLHRFFVPLWYCSPSALHCYVPFKPSRYLCFLHSRHFLGKSLVVFKADTSCVPVERKLFSHNSLPTVSWHCLPCGLFCSFLFVCITLWGLELLCCFLFVCFCLDFFVCVCGEEECLVLAVRFLFYLFVCFWCGNWT